MLLRLRGLNGFDFCGDENGLVCIDAATDRVSDPHNKILSSKNARERGNDGEDEGEDEGENEGEND